MGDAALPRSCTIRIGVGGLSIFFANDRVIIFLVRLCTLLLFSTTLHGSGQSTTSDRNTQAEVHANNGLDLAQSGNLSAAELELRKAVELAPTNPAFLSDLGTVLGMEKKLEESTNTFQRALKLDSNNSTVRRYLAANLWQLHQYVEAKKNLEILVRQDSADKPALLLLGMVSENMKDYASAARILATVPALVREQPESIAALARSYYHLGNREKARATLEQLQTHPAGPKGVFLGAEIADGMQDYATAEKLLISIKTTFPDRSTLGYSLASVEYHARQFDDSRQTLLDLISSGYQSSKIYRLLGWCYQEQHQPAQAAQAFEQAIALEPTQESNYADLSKILIANRSLPAALAVAKRTAQAFPHSAGAFLLQGLVELKVGQFTDAVESYTHAFQLDSANPDASLGLAEAQFAAGMSKDATQTFEASTKQFPRDARFKLQYALILLKAAETGNATAEAHAEELLKSALIINHSLPEVHYHLGNLALKNGRTTEALTYLETAAKLDPRIPETHFALARVYRRLGRKEAASREMEIYQNLQKVESEAKSPNMPDGVSPN